MSVINCNFGDAKVGDIIGLPAPFGFVPEVVGKLVKIDDNGRFKIHTYDLFVLGIWFGRAQAKQDGLHVDWRGIE